MLLLPGRVRVQNGLDSVDKTEPNKHPIQATVLAEYSSCIGSDNYFSEKYRYSVRTLFDGSLGVSVRIDGKMRCGMVWPRYFNNMDVQPPALARLMRRLILRAVRSAVG